MGALLALVLAAQLRVPPWPASPDGEIVGVTGEDAPALAAEGASVARLGGGAWHVVPDPGATRVALRAGAERAVLEVAPPPGDVALSWGAEEVVKGRDATVSLDVAVRTADGALDADAPAPRLAVSPGKLRQVVRTGPGRFRAVYEPPASGPPESAALVAVVPRCPLCPTPRAVGAALLPLAASVELPGATKPLARTTVVVGGRVFGPVRADRRGRFSVEIVVPPGAGVARAHTRDAAGNRSVTVVDLRLPPVRNAACAAWPPAVPADGESVASLWCAASDERRAAAPADVFSVTARAGVVGVPVAYREPLARVAYRAPRGGAGRDEVTARVSPAVAASVPIALASGPPERIETWLAREPVPVGASVAARASVLDAWGDVLGRAAGRPGAGEGFVTPERFLARPDGRPWVQEARVRFSLAPGRDAARLSLRLEGSWWVARARTVDGRPAEGVPLRFGSGAEVRTDARGEARIAAQGTAETVTAPGGLRAAGWQDVDPPEAPIEIERTVEVRLQPRVAAGD